MKSNCCQKEIKTAYGNDGTNCWVCTRCNFPCDPYVKPEPKCLHLPCGCRLPEHLICEHIHPEPSQSSEWEEFNKFVEIKDIHGKSEMWFAPMMRDIIKRLLHAQQQEWKEKIKKLKKAAYKKSPLKRTTYYYHLGKSVEVLAMLK